MAPRVALYTRSSWKSQLHAKARRDDDDRWTLPVQRRALVDECKRRGWAIVAEFCDPGISGETLDARPEMTRLLGEVRASRFDFVLAVEWERFSRSRHGRDWAEILTAFEDGGAKLAIPGQVLDPASPEDSFLAGLFGLLSTREKRKIVARSARGVRERARAGKWSGQAPFGFRIGTDGHLAPHPGEASVVVRIVDLVLGGASCLSVAQTLTADGVPTRQRRAGWSGVQVDRVLRSEALIGNLVFRGTKKGGTEETIRVDAAHPALVDAHRWHGALAVLDARARAGLPRSRWGSGFVLTRMLKCAKCGEPMAGSTSRNRRRPGEDAKFRSYVCWRSRRAGAGAPRCGRVNAPKVERAVLTAVVAALSNRGTIDGVRRQLVEEKLRGNTEDTARRADLDATIADAERRARMLYEDRVASRITLVQFEAWNREQVERQAQARRELREIEDRLLSLPRHADIERVVAQLGDVRHVLEHLEPTDLKELLNSLIASARVTGDDGAGGLRVAIEWRVPGLAAAAVGDVTHAASDAAEPPAPETHARRRRATGEGGRDRA